MKFNSAVSPKAQRQSPCKFLRRSIACVLSASLFLSGCSLIGVQYESPMMGERYALNKILNIHNLKEFDKNFEKYFVGKSTAYFKTVFTGAKYSREIIKKDVFGSISHYYTFQDPDCSLLVLFSKKEDKILGLRRPVYKKIDGIVVPYYRDVDDTQAIYVGDVVYTTDYMGRRQVGDVRENYQCSMAKKRMNDFINFGADISRIDEMNHKTGHASMCYDPAYAKEHSACLLPLE